IMKRALALAIFVAGMAVPAGGSWAQQKSLKDQLVGAWSFVSSTSQRPHGSNTWGPHAAGLLVFTDNGRFSIPIMRGDRPKLQSNTRLRGSLIETQALVRGTLSYFGTYQLDDADRTLTYHIEASFLPNQNGITQKRVITIVGDELRYQNPSPSRGGPP